MDDFRKELVGSDPERPREQDKGGHGRRLASAFHSPHGYFRASDRNGELHLRQVPLLAARAEDSGKCLIEVWNFMHLFSICIA